jgi:hypothetical protein
VWIADQQIGFLPRKPLFRVFYPKWWLTRDGTDVAATVVHHKYGFGQVGSGFEVRFNRNGETEHLKFICDDSAVHSALVDSGWISADIA